MFFLRRLFIPITMSFELETYAQSVALSRQQAILGLATVMFPVLPSHPVPRFYQPRSDRNLLRLIAEFVSPPEPRFELEEENKIITDRREYEVYACTQYIELRLDSSSNRKGMRMKLFKNIPYYPQFSDGMQYEISPQFEDEMMDFIPYLRRQLFRHTDWEYIKAISDAEETYRDSCKRRKLNAPFL